MKALTRIWIPEVQGSRAHTDHDIGYYRILRQVDNERLLTNSQQLESMKDALSHKHEEARRLNKRARRLKLQVQNLERQLQGVRKSRTYRLLRVLDRLRTKVLDGDARLQ